MRWIIYELELLSYRKKSFGDKLFIRARKLDMFEISQYVYTPSPVVCILMIGLNTFSVHFKRCEEHAGINIDVSLFP